MRSFAALLTALSLPLYALAAHHGKHVRRHADVALRARGDLAERGSARLTYYDITVATTACNGNYGSGAFVVALNQAQWDGGSHCGESFPLSYNGVTITVTVVDLCPTCPWGALDCTQGVFKALNHDSLLAGVLYGDWSFAGSNPAPKPSPTPTTPKYTPPAPTSTPEWTPRPASKTPYTPPSSSSSSSSTSTSTSKTSSSTSASKPAYTPRPSTSSTPSATPSSSIPSDLNVPSGGLAQPAGTIADDGEIENLKYIFDLMIYYGDVVIDSQS